LVTLCGENNPTLHAMHLIGTLKEREREDDQQRRGVEPWTVN